MAPTHNEQPAQRTIYKYVLPVDSHPVVKMPRGAKILCAQTQNDQICVWALVDPDPAREQVDRHFRVYGTGHPADETMISEAYLKFIGTVQLRGGALVFHVFDFGDPR